MPIYEYQCPACGSQRELFVKSGAAPAPKCTACGKRMRRVISQTAFILKGSGWYVTDYPSEARKKGMEGEKSPAAPATSTETVAKKEPAPAVSKSPGGQAGTAPAAKKTPKKRP